MIAKLLLILTDLSTPSAQRDSWFAWAAGQVAHAMIGAVLAGGMLFFLPPGWAFIAAALGYAALKELPDFLQDRTWANARDCTHDALFVTAGAALAVAIEGGHDRLFVISVIAAAIGLWLGILARLR